MPTTEANDALPLSNYFAVQLFPGENDNTAVEAVFRASAKQRQFFRRLEVLDSFTVGSNTFLRCRADQEVLGTLLEVCSDGRGVIVRRQSAYVAMLPDGRKGTVDFLRMHLEVKDGRRRLYKGTKIKGWERQFSV